MDEDWVVDSLVGFLQSPVWSFPVEAFTEESCIGKAGEMVRQGGMRLASSVYGKLH